MGTEEVENEHTIAAALKAAKGAQAHANDDLAAIRQAHEKSVEKLQQDLYNKKQQREKKLQDQLAARRKKLRDSILAEAVGAGEFMDEQAAEEKAAAELAPEEATKW